VGTCPVLTVDKTTVNAGLNRPNPFEGTFTPAGTLTFSGTGFPASTLLTLWLDANGDGKLDAQEPFLLQFPVGTLPQLTDAAGNLAPTARGFVADVAAGTYSIYASDVTACPNGACTAADAFAVATIKVSMGISHSKFGSGSTLMVSGVGFPVSTSLNVWYDNNPSGTFTSMHNTVAVTTDSTGAFSTKLVVNGSPTPDALWDALTGQNAVSIMGDFFIHAGPSTAPLQTVQVEVDTCWFQECLIYDTNDQGADTVCLFGNSPQDFFSLLPDCKSLDVNYSNTGYDLTNVGAKFAGAGQLIAAINDLGPLGSACIPVTAAIINAEANGNSVPDKVSMLAIACGAGITPPLDLGLYDLFLSDTPDKGVLFAAIAAIDAAAGAAAGAVLAASAATFAAGPIFGLIVGPATQAALGVSGVDPATATALGASAAGVVVGLISTLGIAAGAAAVIVTPAILIAAQSLLAEAAVAGAIACGYVNSYCNGSDITANILAHPELQKATIPVTFLQPPFKPAPTPNPCPDPNSDCWGHIIGWSKVTCTSADAPGSCEPGKIALPGTASSNNQDPTAAPVRCATGQVVGLSIGYDGDVSFDVGGDDPSVTGLTNYHNFLPGPGGTDPPNGIDIEVPLKNPLNDPGVLLSPAFAGTLSQLRKGMEVEVCGHWVADMHMFWNELHPMTSLTLLPEFSLAASPQDITIQAGETASVALVTTLNSGPSASISFSIASGLPAGASAAFTPAAVTPTLGVPVPSGLTISNLPVGDYPLVVKGQTGSVIRTATVTLHVYDYALVAVPSEDTLLRGGGSTFTVTSTLVPGSSIVGVPAMTLGATGLPADAQASFSAATATPTPAGATTTLAVGSAPPVAGSLGDFAFAVMSVNPSGTTRSSEAVALHLYDFAVSAAQASFQVLTTGSNSDPIAVTLTPSSSLLGLPSLDLSVTGVPAGATASFTPSSGPAAGFSSTLGITTSSAAATPGVLLTIAGTDGRAPEGGSRTTTATLVVLTPAQAIAQIADQIAALKAAHVLNNGQANSLTVKLEHAIDKLGSNPDHPTACNQLNAFINEVNAYVSAGILTPAQASQLLDPPLGVTAIRAAIPC
jgi:hypothetical protein